MKIEKAWAGELAWVAATKERPVMSQTLRLEDGKESMSRKKRAAVVQRGADPLSLNRCLSCGVESGADLQKNLA